MLIKRSINQYRTGMFLAIDRH